MADLNKLESQIGVMDEVTEGTYVAPAAATDYVQPLEDGFDLAVTKETVERTILRPNLGSATPLTSIKRSEGSLVTEFRASGTEGEEPDFSKLMKTALGDSRQTTTQTTTKAAGNTSSVLQIEDADIGDWAVGDQVIILESASHHQAVVTAVDSTGGSANITYSPTASFTPSASVVLAKFVTYFGASASSSFGSLSVTNYVGNGGVSQRLTGVKVNSFSVDNFTTGQIASFNFGIQGLGGTENVESSPFTPSFDSGLPPLILEACIYQDGTQIDINTLTMSVANEIAEKLSTCDPNGVTNLLMVRRSITFSVDPFKSDADVDQFTKFDANTPYSIIALARTESSTAGEFDLGTCVSLYLPVCVTLEKPLSDLNNIVQDAISGQATGGSAGDDTDIYISMT